MKITKDEILDKLSSTYTNVNVNVDDETFVERFKKLARVSHAVRNIRSKLPSHMVTAYNEFYSCFTYDNFIT